MRETKKRLSSYDAIIREAEIKEKQQLYIIRREFCPNCVNCAKECLKLEHIVENSVEVYKCINYVKKID